MTWFKPPYWVRSRTHLRNGCNRFPPCAALPSPLRRVPPCARPSFPPSAATSSSPPCAAATLPPFARLPPVRAALPRRYAGPSLRFASLGGWPPPLRPRPRRWRGVARPAPGAGHSSPRRHACGVHGWAPGGTRSLALARLRLGRCPRREDRRGSSRRSAALFRPAGFGWGRALGCGTRQLAASPTPPPIRAQATPSLTRVVQIRRNGGFPTPLVRPRLPRPFFGLFRALWGL